MRKKLRNLIINIGLPGWIEYKLLWLLSQCKECFDGLYYPQYGVAPHEHNLNKTGSFIGSTEIIDENKWPDNYVDHDKGCGVYYCPVEKCKYSKVNQNKKLYKLYNKQ